MNRDEIISMANTAGFTASVSIEDCGDVPFVKLPQPIPKSTELFSMLRQFADLVAAAEREACLVMVTDILAGYRADIIWQDGFDHNLQHPIQAITAAFKERGEK